MANEVLAEAVVELEADVDKFNKDFKRSLKQAEKDAKDSTDEVDKSFKTLTGNLGKEFERASKEFARQYREQEREAKRVQREIEREAKRVQREIEAETRRTSRELEREAREVERESIRAQRAIEVEAKRVQREIERENARVARENIKAQNDYEREFIASQRAMEKAAAEAQRRQTDEFRKHVSTLRKFASERFSLTLGVDTSQLGGALATASKLGAVLGAVGIGALAGQASIAGITQVALAIQDLVGAIALLPAVGASAGIVIGTITLGLRGLGDAIKADSAKELDESFKSLSANGKKFATVIRDLKDEFDDFTKGIQQSLLANFDKEVSQLAKVLLPLLSKGFNGVATELNHAAHQLVGFIKEAQTLKDIEHVFSNTQQSVLVFRRSLAPLAAAFRDIVAVGSDFLPVIAADIGGAAKNFADFIAEARKSGQLATFFENAIQSVRTLFTVIGNIGSILDAILDNARMVFGPGGFLGLLERVTERVDEFVHTLEGQVAILNFFENLNKAADLVLPILGKLADLLFNTLIPALVQIGTVAAPAINMLIDGLSRGLKIAIPGIVSFVDSLASIVISLVDAGVLDALGELVRVLGTTLGAAIRRLAPTLGNLINSILIKLADILPKILPALGKFADAFANLVIAALPVVDVLADIISKVGLPTLQRIAETLTPLIADLADSLGDVLLPILPDLADAFGELIDALGPIVDDILVAFVALLKAVVPLLPAFVRSIVQLAVALTPLIELFGNLAELFGLFIDKLYAIPGVKKFMQEDLPLILALLTGTLIVPIGKLLELLDKLVTKLDDAGVFDVIIEALGKLADALAITSEGFRRFGQFFDDTWNFIKEVARASVDFVSQLIFGAFDAIKNFFITIWEGIKQTFNQAWEFIKAVVNGAIQFILGIITGGFNLVPEVVRGALGRMRDAAVDAFNRLLDLVRDLPNRIISALGNVGSLLFSAGQSLIQGFINGVTSMAGSLASQAANAAKGALESAKRALGISSPSRAMMDVGEDYGAGFVVGIENMLRRVAEAGADLATQTVQASTGALAPNDNSVFRMNETLNRLTRNGLGPAPVNVAPRENSTAEQSVVVSPEVHVYIGNEEINDHITDVVDERDRRTKRSLTMGARRIV